MATSSILNQVKISDKESTNKFIKAADESQSTQVCKEDWVKMGYTDSESEELAMLSNIYKSNKAASVYECSNCKQLTFGTSDYCICGAKIDLKEDE